MDSSAAAVISVAGIIESEAKQTKTRLEIDEETMDAKSLTSSCDPREEELRTKKFVIVVAVAAALGGMIFGYDLGGAGATFLMDGFRLHFGWDCTEGDLACVPASGSTINTDEGLINGLFGAGAAM